MSPNESLNIKCSVCIYLEMDLTHLLFKVLLGGQCELVSGWSFPGLCFEERLPSYGFSPWEASHSNKLWLQC